MSPFPGRKPIPARASLALLEIGNLAPALLLADRCAKAAGVCIIGIESADSAEQCISIAGPEREQEFGQTPVRPDTGKDLLVFDLSSHDGSPHTFTFESIDEFR